MKDMKLRKLPVLFMFTLLVTTLCFATLLPLAKAEPSEYPPGYPEEPTHNPYVWIDDPDDETNDYFEYPGETVWIWSYSSKVPYTVTVWRTPPGQSYSTYVEPTILVTSYDVYDTGWHKEVLTGLTFPGTTWWKAEIGLTAKGTFFVIPEVPLGIVAALVACFASLGVRRLQLIRGAQ